MARARHEIDPKVAAIRARNAAARAGRYSSRNLSAMGRRTGAVWTVLRYGPPPSRRRMRVVFIGSVVAAGALGAATALAAQRGAAARRRTDAEDGFTERAGTATQPVSGAGTSR